MLVVTSHDYVSVYAVERTPALQVTCLKSWSNPAGEPAQRRGVVRPRLRGCAGVVAGGSTVCCLSEGERVLEWDRCGPGQFVEVTWLCGLSGLILEICPALCAVGGPERSKPLFVPIRFECTLPTS